MTLGASLLGSDGGTGRRAWPVGIARDGLHRHPLRRSPAPRRLPRQRVVRGADEAEPAARSAEEAPPDRIGRHRITCHEPLHCGFAEAAKAIRGGELTTDSLAAAVKIA
jgi:hypothetical protein